jgi:hypothetical protein
MVEEEEEREGANPALVPAVDLQADFVETLQRCVIVALLQSICADIAQWPVWPSLIQRTNNVDDPRFLVRTTQRALSRFRPKNPDMCNLFADLRWDRYGGARYFLHCWHVGTQDLLARIQWLREQAAPTPGRRIQIPPLENAALEEAERTLCTVQRVLTWAYIPERLWSVELWSVMQDRKLFWHVWWGTAEGRLGLQPDQEFPDSVLEDCERRILLLTPTARILFTQNRWDAIAELDSLLAEDTDDWLLTEAPAFAFALDRLGLRAYADRELAHYRAMLR